MFPKCMHLINHKTCFYLAFLLDLGLVTKSTLPPRLRACGGMPGSGKGLRIGLREETKTARGDF